jgi:hypothetical protein
MEKNCCKCKRNLPLSQFNKNKRAKDGLCYKCKDCYHLYSREYERTRISTPNRRLRCREYYKENREDILKQKKIYAQANKSKIRSYQNEYLARRKQEDISMRILLNLRTRISKILRGKVKDETTRKFIGCSLEELKSYLESKFSVGMNWENYGYYGWHIDHIRPCSSFDLNDPEEQKLCFHYTNLQPLWGTENMAKGDKF